MRNDLHPTDRSLPEHDTLNPRGGEFDEEFAVASELRVIDLGDSLTIGRVFLDPYGDPYSYETDTLYADNLSGLREMVREITLALSRPAVNSRDMIQC